jgi:hypothetical protein
VRGDASLETACPYALPNRVPPEATGGTAQVVEPILVMGCFIRPDGWFLSPPMSFLGRPTDRNQTELLATGQTRHRSNLRDRSRQTRLNGALTLSIQQSEGQCPMLARAPLSSPEVAP